ncbi:MAG: mandelate racemase/muconate lactonizing enzyme family protein [Chloroflexi bacterium]|nr:mandelate racemase/muconate lactonizing enzyme family protein [Chloroflexota bacterium]
MKITDVECLILDRSFPFVRIYTDEGIVGIGECFRRQPSVIKTLIDDLLKPALIGKDPTETAVRFDDMQRAASGYELGGAVWCAIAGLDIALWDIKGKALNQPIANLLGGMKRDKIRMYASSMRRDMTPLEEGQRAASFVEQGYSGYKLHSAIPGAMDDPRDYTIATVTEVRAAVGDNIDILVDVNGAYSVHHAMDIGKALESLGVFHFEEPRPHYDLDGLATIADALDIPIASGEMIYTQYEYRDLILRGKVDIIQPDIVKAPGFTEFVKIAELCRAFSKPITVHNTQPILSTVAHLHFCAAYADIVPYSQEYNIEPISLRDEISVLKEPLQVEDGYLAVPTGPGLGVEFDEDALKQLAAR